MDVTQIIEALIFVADEPLTKKEIVSSIVNSKAYRADNMGTDEKNLPDETDKSLEILRKKYESDAHAFHLVYIADGWQFLTKKEFYPYVKESLLIKSRKKLSQQGLETLAIIAYKQPVTKSEVEFIRGVNCDHIIQSLLDKQLITISGKAKSPGAPLLYETTDYFLQYLGLSSLKDLPKPEDIKRETTDVIDSSYTGGVNALQNEPPSEAAKE